MKICANNTRQREEETDMDLKLFVWGWDGSGWSSDGPSVLQNYANGMAVVIAESEEDARKVLGSLSELIDGEPLVYPLNQKNAFYLWGSE